MIFVELEISGVYHIELKRHEYVISTPYALGAAAGFRWDDPTIGVRWPFDPTVMSHADATHPPLDIEGIRRDGLASLAAREACQPIETCLRSRRRREHALHN